MSPPGRIALGQMDAFALPSPAGGDKEDRGRVLVVAGGARVPGAAILTGLAALRVGAGKLQLAATSALAPGLGLAVPEAAIIPVRAKANGEFPAGAAPALKSFALDADAIVIGPGMSDKVSAGGLTRELARTVRNTPFVVDAGALMGLGPHLGADRFVRNRLVLTPHAGEMAGLLGQTKETIEADALKAGRELAVKAEAVVVMKGATTFLVAPDGAAWVHEGGVIGLGTSGSGDILAGLIAGFMARGATPLAAAAWGIWVHGRAGERLGESVGPLGFLARELLDEAPKALAEAFP